jgi:hypothetical protein
MELNTSNSSPRYLHILLVRTPGSQLMASRWSASGGSQVLALVGPASRSTPLLPDPTPGLIWSHRLCYTCSCSAALQLLPAREGPYILMLCLILRYDLNRCDGLPWCHVMPVPKSLSLVDPDGCAFCVFCSSPQCFFRCVQDTHTLLHSHGVRYTPRTVRSRPPLTDCSICAVLPALENCQKRLSAPSCLSCSLSAWNHAAPTGRIFIKFDIRGFFETVTKFQVSLKSDKNNGCLHTWRPMYIYDSISLSTS